MPNSPTSSHASAPCRLEWRPSRWLTLALFALGLLAALGVVASEMPLVFSIPLALAAAGEGARLARRESRRASRWLVVTGDGCATLDGVAIGGIHLRWRGPLAFVRFQVGNGRRQRLVWWPDTLPPHERRELRLAIPVQPAAQPGPSMAS
jgi:toxin CptA